MKKDVDTEESLTYNAGMFNNEGEQTMLILKSQTALEGLTELHQILTKEVDQHKLKADESFPPVLPVGEWPNLNSFTFGYGGKCSLGNMSTLFKTTSYSSSYDYKDLSTTDQLSQRKTEIDAKLVELEQKILECEEANKESIQSNVQLREKITLVMRKIGVTDTYSVNEVPKGARTSKWVTHQAGYMSDMNRCIPVSIEGIRPDVVRIRQSIEQGYQSALEAVRKVEREKQQKESEVLKQHDLALLRAKYCPDNAYALLEDVRQALLCKNKYLCLAYWMERNRGDWSDGYNYASIGHDQFSVEDETDKEIDNEIGELIRNEDGYIDGRCFRDCKWNYGVLYSMCKDAALLEDLNKIKEMEQ